jgi:hypothetical protein
MKNIVSSGQVAKIAALIFGMLFSPTTPAFSQTRLVNAASAGAVYSASWAMPRGVKVLAQVPLDGQPVTRMYTQWERGRTYLYIEHGNVQLTTVDVTKKRNPQIVDHGPAKVEAAKSQPAEGGMLEVSAPNVIAEFDNVGGRGMLGIVQGDNPDDAQLLQAFGRDSSNLVDRDRNLIFFASSTRLAILEDNRWRGMDYNIN